MSGAWGPRKVGHIAPPQTLTAQAHYYAQLGRCERLGDYAQAAALRTVGPPAPEPADGITGALAYFRYRADHGDTAAAKFVRQHTFSATTPATWW
ncbi:hypothetical protein [Nocardia sp. N2S4-5]|uniref:hypothetical protein n=1 Tax=Nocardia sp. N2S4-5 TaxID=3351565 RepID=UPI0037D6829E